MNIACAVSQIWTTVVVCRARRWLCCKVLARGADALPIAADEAARQFRCKDFGSVVGGGTFLRN